jgi:hypothetical protein
MSMGFKCYSAIGKVADERLFSCVNPHVGFKVSFFIERFIAVFIRAYIWFYVEL